MSNVPPTDRYWARGTQVLPAARERRLVARIMFDINTTLRRRQPDDMGWIDVESIRVAPLHPRQVLAAPETDPRSLPWVNFDKQRVWEPAVCYYADDAGRYDVMSAHDF